MLWGVGMFGLSDIVRHSYVACGVDWNAPVVFVTMIHPAFPLLTCLQPEETNTIPYQLHNYDVIDIYRHKFGVECYDRA